MVKISCKREEPFSREMTQSMESGLAQKYVRRFKLSEEKSKLVVILSLNFFTGKFREKRQK